MKQFETWWENQCTNPEERTFARLFAKKSWLKQQAEIDRLREGIFYALAQEDLSYSMPEDEAIKFRMRKVFSILTEVVEREEAV